MPFPFSYQNKREGKKKAGFTLIEIMVSVTIFSIVMVIAMGAVFTIINTNRKAQSLKSVMDNLNSAIENMTRTIKTGAVYSIDSPTYPDTCQGNSITESNAIKVGDAIVNDVYGNQVTYSLGSVDENGIAHSDGHQIVKKIVQPLGGGTTITTVTAPEVTIERMCFYIGGNRSNDGEQPEVIMVLEGSAGVGKTKTNFNLQTAITERLLDS